jgi:ABC-type Zn uptake system ZnuABC Zn-binding protein ZnuA
VVTTIPDYSYIAQRIGGDRVTCSHIVLGDQDAHFIRPKPSFVNLVASAKVLVATGLDLELWLPTVVDKSGNRHVRSGQTGYVAGSHGMRLLEKPAVLSKVEGGLHIHGNPHVTCSPVMMKRAARNIAIGLIKNDPAGKATYQSNLSSLLAEMDRRTFGDTLVKLLGGDQLCKMAEQGKLHSFLQSQKYRGKPLSSYAGGWLRKMLPLRGTSICTYHKNWVYFLHLFGMKEAGTVEPKPGIPPSAKHVAQLINLMKQRNIKIILAANYFDESKVRSVATKVGARPVIVPLYVGGAPGTEDYFKLVDHWVNSLTDAAKRVGLYS